MSLFTYLRAFVRNDEGQDLLEYALLVALIALMCVLALQGAQESISGVFDRIADQLGVTA